MLTISLEPAADPAALETAWRSLETRADLSFFQSWTWTGCLYDARFRRPMLLRAQADGVDLALGLFNRGRWSLHLGESGVAENDSIYIEHNGVICVRDCAPDLPGLLRAARAGGWKPQRLILSGVDDACLAAARAAGGRVVIRRTHVAPVLDLAVAGVDWMTAISANTRQNLRRSARDYAALGALRLDRAVTVAQAHAFLDALAVLHQRTWESRGKSGAFARPFFRRFHRELIARGVPRDEVDLLRVSAGDVIIGYLYNFRYRGRVLAYQSGFDYQTATGARRPGMTCHRMAIDMYAAMGARAYDFLAGNDRYKRSLANAETTMHWVTLYPALSDFLRR